MWSSVGFHTCPGRNLAILEINMIAATMLVDFDIRLAELEKEWRYYGLFIVN